MEQFQIEHDKHPILENISASEQFILFTLFWRVKKNQMLTNTNYNKKFQQ